MKLSESIQKDIMKTSPEGIVNRFRGKPRRTVFFFEDIFSSYIKLCEEGGFAGEIRSAAQEWAALVTTSVAPDVNSLTSIFNSFKPIWINAGLLDELEIVEHSDHVEIQTKNEHTTRLIGKNNFAIGMYEGVLNAIKCFEFESLSTLQTKQACIYNFKQLAKKFEIELKKITSSMTKRESICCCFTLKKALEKKFFVLNKYNRITFRGKSVFPLENTIFHILSNKNLCLNQVAEISHKFLRGIIADSNEESKLGVLKNLLQAMGWGIVNISKNSQEIIVKIENLPQGLQVGKDNFEFLARFVQGYIMLFSECELSQIRMSDSNLLYFYKLYN